MRLLRRNTTVFDYMAYTGETEQMNGGLHTGNFVPTYVILSQLTVADREQIRSRFTGKEIGKILFAIEGFGIDHVFQIIIIR